MTNTSFVTALSILLLILMVSIWPAPYNDTDDSETGTLSGLSVYTDNLTGCQYIKAGLVGGISPRLDHEGHQLGCF